jgi:hypothetical protein
VSKRSLGSAAAMKAGNATHRKERDRHRQKMQRKYEMYCTMITTEHPGLIPSSFVDWVAFNKAMDQSEPREIHAKQ